MLRALATVLLLVSAAAPAPAPVKLWERALPAPFQPISLALAGQHGTALLGLRNCPDNTQDKALQLSIRNGSTLPGGDTIVPGAGDAVAARRGPAGKPLPTAATGW